MPPPLPIDPKVRRSGRFLAVIGLVLIGINVLMSLVGWGRLSDETNRFREAFSRPRPAEEMKEEIRREVMRYKISMQAMMVTMALSLALSAGGTICVAVAILTKHCYEPWLFWATFAAACALMLLCGLHITFGVSLLVALGLRQSQFSLARHP